MPTGPWEDFKTQKTENGPWLDFGPKSGQMASPGRGGRHVTREQEKALKPAEDYRYGIPTLATGMEQITTPGERKKGLHNVISGTAETASPFAIPTLVAAPVATAAGLAGSYLGGKAGKGAATLAGADEDTANLVGDAGSVVGGLGGSRFEMSPRAARTAKAAAEAFTPKWVENFHGKISNALSKVAGAWNAKSPEVTAASNRLLELTKEQEKAIKPPPRQMTVEEPFKPSSATKRQMGAYSGTADPNYSAPGKPVGMSGSADRFKTPQEIEASKQVPAKTPTPPERFKPNPAVSRKMGFGGPNTPDYGRSGSTVGGKGSVERFRTPEELAKAKAAAEVTKPQAGPKPAAEKPSPKSTLPSPKPTARSNVNRAEMLADILRKADATPALAKMVTADQWKTIATQAGLKDAPDAATIKAAIDLLGKPKQIRVTRR